MASVLTPPARPRVTAAVGGSGRRRASPTPGYYTRAQVESDLGLTPTERDTFERADIIGPRQRRARGDTRPLLYSTSDLAVARLAMAAHRMGLRGEQLRRLVEAVRLKQRRLVPGWTGVAIADGDGDVELVPDGADLSGELAARGAFEAVVIVHVRVPDLPEHP